ncbi:MAG: hypothetical protein ABI607_13860 [Betaproteobacteria bacterium]
MSRAARVGHACGAGLLVLALSACASETLKSGTPREVMGHRINPYELHEECVKMTPGDVLDYHFTTQRPVAFNIHYHEGKSVILPVSRNNVTSDEGTYQPLLPQEYCLMWEAGREGAILDYRVKLIRAKR